MKQMIPYEKLQKKQQRALSAKRRGTWGNVNPVTKSPESKKVYNRKRAAQWSDNPYGLPF